MERVDLSVAVGVQEIKAVQDAQPATIERITVTLMARRGDNKNGYCGVFSSNGQNVRIVIMWENRGSVHKKLCKKYMSYHYSLQQLLY